MRLRKVGTVLRVLTRNSRYLVTVVRHVEDTWTDCGKAMWVRVEGPHSGEGQLVRMAKGHGMLVLNRVSGWHLHTSAIAGITKG